MQGQTSEDEAYGGNTRKGTTVPELQARKDHRLVGQPWAKADEEQKKIK